MLARRIVHESPDATPNPHHSPSAQVMRKQLRRVAGLSRLPRRKEPVLSRRDLEEPVPVGRFCSRRTHAQALSHTLVLRKDMPRVFTRNFSLAFVSRGKSSCTTGGRPHLPHYASDRPGLFAHRAPPYAGRPRPNSKCSAARSEENGRGTRIPPSDLCNPMGPWEPGRRRR